MKMLLGSPRTILVAGGLVLCAAAVAARPAASRWPSEQGEHPSFGSDRTVTVRVDGRVRSALVYAPAGAPAAGAWPVLVIFHGGGGNAAGFRRSVDFDALADEEGFVAVYPNGTGPLRGRALTWNAGGCCGPAQRRGVDDVKFVWALLAEIVGRLPLDPARVYFTGHSNGAMMAYRVAAESAPRVAAVAAVAGAMNLDDFAPEAPVPLLHVHSVDDPRALYGGGLGPPFPLTRTRVLHRPVEATLALWAGRNGCRPEAHELEKRTSQAADGPHRAELLSYEPCESGSPVRLWRLHGPGHGWPGGRSILPERLVGPSTTVIDAAVEVWRFVSAFRRPDAPALR